MADRPASGRNSGDRSLRVTLVTDEAVSAWFLREILPHESNLMLYLHQNWRNASEISDLRQEIYVRVFEAAKERLPDNPKSFLFVCARNHLIDRVRRDQIVPMETFADLDVLGFASDAPEPDHLLIKREDARRLNAAMEQLPPRTREAVTLAFFEGLTGKEVARRMGVGHRVASRFIARGAAILADILREPSRDRSTKS